MLLNVDLSTVLTLHETSLMVGALVFLHVRRQSTQPQGLGLLAVGFAALALGAVLAGMGESRAVPVWLWTHCSLWLGMLGYALLWAGFGELDGRPNWLRTRWVLLLPAAVGAAGLVSGFPYQNLWRASAFHTGAVLALALAAWQIQRGYRQEDLPGRQLLAAALALSAGVYAANLFNLLMDFPLPFGVEDAFFVQILCNFGIALLTVSLVSQRSARRLQQMAQTDPLTGVGNRRWFLAQLPAQVHTGAVVVMDLDHFKQINDRFGHAVGDQVLVDFAHCVNSMLGAGERFARYGGEEFSLFLPHASAAEALALAERLRQGVEQQVHLNQDVRVPVTVSLGVASATPHDLSWQALLHRADQALYAAKSAGRNRVMA
ncbi:diguanylate cyclase (GGDEF)-like protein [Rhodoferax ferrireducens]|uniref:diguanylate cyclase n=1 Tax=Rhodoferax ferrireducens TaxID=192843 RepID=A0ABU2CEX2_9BURK|nr:GGDEF domain-containing protein [Rhodoferax ferrireducens]MDR7379882.1 diguanylate cyclase (GGDEF)-like protein [Rhodoferax ferrireducens]